MHTVVTLKLYRYSSGTTVSPGGFTVERRIMPEELWLFRKFATQCVLVLFLFTGPFPGDRRFNTVFPQFKAVLPDVATVVVSVGPGV